MKSLTVKVNVKVAEVWIEDGFPLTVETLQKVFSEAMENRLGYARPDEVVVKVTK